jgi:hypothetical protein
MAKSSLRVVLVLSDPDAPPGWIARLASRIAELGEIELCALADPASAAERRRRPRRGSYLYRWLYRLELLAGAGRVPGGVGTPPVGWNDLPRIAADDEAALAALKPDVILDLSGNHGRGLTLGKARHGVWFTDAVDTATGLAGLRPLLDGQPVSQITLFRRTKKHPIPEAIASAAVNIKFIAARNEVFLTEKSVTLILRELRRVAAGLAPLPLASDVLFVAPVAPGLRESLAYLGHMSGELVRRSWQVLCGRLGLRPGMFCLNLAKGDLLKFKPAQALAVNPQGNCYHADPFLWQHGEESWCFFESFDYASGMGHISAGRLDADGIVDIRAVLKPDYHVSFPFLFEHGGELFMMPESCAMRRIELWRCTAFPDCWELHSTALEGSNLADSTLAEIDGQWWLFSNLCDDPFGDMNSELHLFRADGPLLGRLEAHPLNPVVFDSRNARNAGRILVRDGVLLRPSQDNSHGTYGYGLNLMRIEELTMESYRESSARVIAPTFGRGIIGCHHIDVLGDRIVFDVRHRLGGRG